ncbi:Ras family [seawater metagenome]|uniref:Ras family n=1 Tax=seawater metagenome TaxID=1561972 RepID=A0A5E8CJS8_9ZZZZ
MKNSNKRLNNRFIIFRYNKMVISKKIKVTFVGDTAVGKTSIIEKYILGRFDEFKEATIGAAYSCKNVLLETQNVKLEIWDTAGQERFRSLVPMYYRQADVIVLVYSITNLISYESIDFWLDEIYKTIGNENYSIFIVGNKCDLPKKFNNNYIIDIIRDKLGENIKIIHILTSSKTGKNIDLLFKMLLKCSSKSNIIDNKLEVIKPKYYNEPEICYC